MAATLACGCSYRHQATVTNPASGSQLHPCQPRVAPCGVVATGAPSTPVGRRSPWPWLGTKGAGYDAETSQRPSCPGPKSWLAASSAGKLGATTLSPPTGAETPSAPYKPMVPTDRCVNDLRGLFRPGQTPGSRTTSTRRLVKKSG